MNDCIIWSGFLNKDGYGEKKQKGKSNYIHRATYEDVHGPIPNGLVIDHLCRNRACYNVEHLEAVTVYENTHRGLGPTAINKMKTHCAGGHKFTKETTYIYTNGRRRCRKCAYIWLKEARARKKK